MKPDIARYRGQQCSEGPVCKSSNLPLLAGSVQSEALDDPGLHELRERHVRGQDGNKCQQVLVRQRDQVQSVCEMRHGKPQSEQADGSRGPHQSGARLALQERDLARANDMHDQRLRQQRLDEPPALEEGWIVPGAKEVQAG